MIKTVSYGQKRLEQFEIEIHPTAIVAHDVKLGAHVKVGPYSIVGAGAVIGHHTVIDSHVKIGTNARIGRYCHIYHGAAIGTEPQDLKFENEKSFVRIGDYNTFREYVTVNRGTFEAEVTEIGNNNLFMAYSHVAHNCKIGNNVIMANAVNLGGHVSVDDFVVLGGVSAVHQFTRIGKYAMIGGCSRVVSDIVPYIRCAGNRLRISGLNVIGLRRNGFTSEKRALLKRAYKILFRSNLNTSAAVEMIENTLQQIEEIAYLVKFIKSSQRGIAK